MSLTVDPAEVAYNCFEQLLPPESFNFVTDFAKTLSPGMSGTLLVGEAPGDIPQGLVEAAKKVAGAAVSALLKEVEKFLSTPTQGALSGGPGLGDVGKMITNLKATVPLVNKLAAAYAQPHISAGNNPLPIPQPVSAACLYHVANSASTQFINEIQARINNLKPVNTQAGAVGFDWSILKQVGSWVANAAAGALPVILPLIQQRLAPSTPTTITAKASEPSSYDASEHVSKQAVNYTTVSALNNTYKQTSVDPAIRGVQAIVAVAQKMHGEAIKKHGFAAVHGPNGDEWWKLFEKAVSQVAPVVSQFNITQRTDASLDDSSAVQSAAVSAGLVSGAHVVGQTYKTSQNITAENLGSFWDVVKDAVSTVGGVIGTVAPVAAKIIPLLL